MEHWPVKPEGMGEREWYRQLEKTVKLTVISADEQEGRCPACGFRALLFQCQSSPDRQIRCFCKMCAIAFAGGPELLWVRTEAYLRQKWVRNGKDPAKAERLRATMAERRSPAPDGGRAACGVKERIYRGGGLFRDSETLFHRAIAYLREQEHR